MDENNYTLEQMRSDYQALKAALDKQEIINDRLLRETMRGKVSSIRRKVAVSVACAVSVMLTAPFIFHYNPVFQVSWWFIAGTELLMAGCLFFDLKFNHKVQSFDISSCDLLTFSKDVRSLKERYRKWVKWGLAMAVLWTGWLCAEAWIHSEEHTVTLFMTVGLAVGLLIGGILGYSLDRKIIGTCDEIISSIED